MICRPTHLAESIRGHSSLSNQVCYSSFLAVAAKLYRSDSIFVVVYPCSSVHRSNSSTQFGVFRIG